MAATFEPERVRRSGPPTRGPRLRLVLATEVAEVRLSSVRAALPQVGERQHAPPQGPLAELVAAALRGRAALRQSRVAQGRGRVDGGAGAHLGSTKVETMCVGVCVPASHVADSRKASHTDCVHARGTPRSA